jgi:hypothetical protein
MEPRPAGCDVTYDVIVSHSAYFANVMMMTRALYSPTPHAYLSACLPDLPDLIAPAVITSCIHDVMSIVSPCTHIICINL